MIGLDTNVLVRYLAQDDALQSPQASRLMESLTLYQQGYVCLIVLVELVWVMQGAYRARKAEIVAIIDQLLTVDAIAMEHESLVQEALSVFMASHADFADCLIERCAVHADCVRTFTFDAKAASTAGMYLLG